MRRHRDRAWSQEPQKPTCFGCGKPVDPNQMNALVEPIQEQCSPDGEKLAWHRHCFDHFLDEGEEI